MMRQLVDRFADAIRLRGLPWTEVFRQRCIAFHHPNGSNLIRIWTKENPSADFSVRLPRPLHELDETDPYPELDGRWLPDPKMWGWKVPAPEQIPDVGKAVDLTVRLQA
jgi:hypothetical protein